MASPQIENGYTTIANEILDHLYKQPLNGTELKVVMCILRYTFGFRRKSHKLSASFIAKWGSCDVSSVKRALKHLRETMQGGNGVGGTFGNTMDNFIQTLQRRGDIISGSATEIWNLKESLEKEGMTAEEKSSATQKLIDKLGEMGVTSEQATQAFETLRQKGLITDDMFDILSESIKTLGNDTTNMASQINLGSQSAQKSYDDLKLVIGNLTNQMHLGTDEQGQLLNALERTVDSGGTAQDAYNNVMAAVKTMGGNTETAARIFSEVFPNAVQATKTSVDKNIVGAQQTVTTSTGKMKTDAETNLAGLQKAAEDASGGVSTATVTNWGNSAAEVDKNLDQMKQHANLKLARNDLKR